LFQGEALTLASLLVLGHCGLVHFYAPMIMKNHFLAYAVLGIYYANPQASDHFLTTQIVSAINAYLLSRVVHRHVVSAEKLKGLVLLVSSGLTHNLSRGLNDSLLIDILKNAPSVVKRAVVLLWQNDFCDSSLLTQLKNNDECAKKIIQLAFDDNWDGVKSLLDPAMNKVEQITSPRSLFFTPLRLSSVPELTKSPLVLAKKLHKHAATDDMKKTLALDSLFFAPERKSKKTTGQAALHAHPWRG
ncbi:MAG: hypothetical protein PSV35_02445, partial [bacterium]|nr:hypothetical protein [bacterium]